MVIYTNGMIIFVELLCSCAREMMHFPDALWVFVHVLFCFFSSFAWEWSKDEVIEKRKALYCTCSKLLASISQKWVISHMHLFTTITQEKLLTNSVAQGAA